MGEAVGIIGCRLMVCALRHNLLDFPEAQFESAQTPMAQHPDRSCRTVHKFGDTGDVQAHHDPQHQHLGLIGWQLSDESDRLVGSRVGWVLDEVGPTLAGPIPISEPVACGGVEPAPESVLVAFEGRKGLQDPKPARYQQPGPRRRAPP